MNIKNYTSEISADTSVVRIERMLVSAGADGIQKLFQNGQLSSLMFKIQFEPNSPPVAVKLPANVDACLESMWREYQKNSIRGRKGREDFREQAVKTAWKLVQDWCEVQISLIHLKQVEFLQVFLPYVVTGASGQTYYESIRENGFKALLPEKI